MINMKKYEKPSVDILSLQSEVIMSGEELDPLVNISAGVELD